MTLFGVVDAAYAKGTGTVSSKTQLKNSGYNSSRIGFRGVEDLGGGLKASFDYTLETGAQRGSLTTRADSGIALSGGFGKLAIGQYDNPLFTYGYTYNPFGSSMAFSPTMRHYYYGMANVGQSSVVVDGDTKSLAGVGIDTGFVNSVTYETPVMGGLMATLQYSPKESGDSASYAAALSYNAGPFSAALTYVKSGIVSPAYDSDEKVWSLGTSYDFGMVKAFLQYTAIDQDASTVGSVQAANEDKIYQVGVSVLVATHDLGLIARMRYRTLTLKAGRMYSAGEEL